MSYPNRATDWLMGLSASVAVRQGVPPESAQWLLPIPAMWLGTRKGATS